MNKRQKRLKEINDKHYILIDMDNKYIKYEDSKGYRYKKYIYNKSPLNTTHKFDEKNEYALYNIEHMLELSGTNTTIIKDSFKGGKSLISFKCGRCGKVFKSLIGNFVKYKYKVCGDCVHEVQDTKLQDYEQIRREVESYGYTLLSSRWCGNHTRINVQDKEGYKGRIKLEALREGGQFHMFGMYNPYTLENLRLFAKKNNYTCTIPNQKMEDYNDQLKCVCECGEKFVTSIGRFVYGNKYRCDKCSNTMSNLELSVKNWLDDNGIHYISQYAYDDCKYKNKLRFDFYLPKYNCCIEVNGGQHYFPVDYFGGDTAFKKQQIRDKIKRDYCKHNNIQFISLSYKEINDNSYKSVLKKII